MKQDENAPARGDGSAPGKKKYRRPEILYREPLEAMAALCTPRPPAKADVGSCPLAQRS